MGTHLLRRTSLFRLILLSVLLLGITGTVLAGCGKKEAADAETAEQENTEEGLPAYMEKIPEDDPLSGSGKNASASNAGNGTGSSSGTLWYTGKSVSIIGDSISTWSGVIPDDYNQNYPQDDVDDVSKTWWMQVIDKGGMTLDCNASFSGGLTTGDSYDMSGSTAIGVRRLQDVSKDSRTGEAKEPDIILIMTGTNDCIQQKEIGSYEAGQTSAEEGEIEVFADAYDFLLTKLSAMYPSAQIICLTCVPMGYGEEGTSIEKYNAQIRQVAMGHSIPVIDTYNCGLNPAEDLYDGIHPKTSGMTKIADMVLEKLESAPGSVSGMRELN